MKTSKIILSLFLTYSSTLFAQQLSDMIPAPFYENQIGKKNEITVLENGLPSLQARVDLIRRAKKSIEVEYFIYNTDIAGKIFTRELVAAAKERKVKVRILVDKSIAVLELNEHYAKELAKYGIEVRYYNNASLYRVSTVQFRNHRKLLIVDDTEVITGGRNIGDDYFDLSPRFNFNDLDVLVKGPIVKGMRKTFDKFFEHDITERPELPTEYSEKNTPLAVNFLKQTQEELAVRARMAKTSDQFFKNKKSHVCLNTTYSTDAPGGDFVSRLDPKFDEKYRFLRKTLYDKIISVDKKITISSPYMINNSESSELYEQLLRKNVEIQLYTNSLGSTDAIYVAANLYLGIYDWLKKGVQISLHDGKWLGEDPLAPAAIRNANWGTHTKSMIFESKKHSEMMVGTYNVDNRSNFYNTEIAVFCRDNNELTEEVKGTIQRGLDKAIRVHKNGNAVGRDSRLTEIYGDDLESIIKMKLITLPSWLLKQLL